MLASVLIEVALAVPVSNEVEFTYWPNLPPLNLIDDPLADGYG